jgi:hypothetical protein
MKPPPHPDPHHHTAHVATADPRGAIDLSAAENADLCAGCVRCCTYITIEIDAPRAAWEYDQWLWALEHQGIDLYVERPERWYVHVETRCGRLGDDGRCTIHGRHPVLCREYDPRTCERRVPLHEIRAWFRDAESFEAWIRTTRPAHWARLEAYRRAMPAGPPVADASRTPAPALITIGAMLARPGGAVTGASPRRQIASSTPPARRARRSV